jgi:hypothetical protein
VTLRPGSRIRYLLTDERGAAKRHGRAMGFLDGSETPDIGTYEEMLREAAEEVLPWMAASD